MMELYKLLADVTNSNASGVNINDPVFIAAISAVSGVIIAYITNITAKKVAANKASKQPKDRMEQMFDGYERLIKQKDLEDDRKQKYIKIIESELTATKLHVGKLEEAMERTNDELSQSRTENQQLRDQLNEMRKEYQTAKNT